MSNITINESYIDFILNNFIKTIMRIDIPEPMEKGSVSWSIGPSLFMDINVKTYVKYKRSVKFTLIFDKYETDVLIYMPLNKNPNEILHRIHKKISNTVYNTFIEDGRKDYIIEQYSELRKKIFSNIKINFNNETND